MTIVWPSDTKTIIDEIRSTIGRNILVNVAVTGIPCSTCTLDPINNESTDPLCSECDGLYWKSTVSGWTVKAHVRWGSADRPIYTPGGKAFEGDCIVTIEYTASGLSNIENSESFVVDNKELIMEDFILKGVPDINRITIALVEKNN